MNISGQKKAVGISDVLTEVKLISTGVDINSAV